MSWDEELFAVLDDLESQASAAFAREREAELVDRSRAEYATVTLAGRLMASLEQELVLDVAGVGRIQGTLERVASGWLLVDGSSSDWIVVLASVSAVEGSSTRAVPDVAWPAVARLGLGSALRRLAETAERCVLWQRDGSTYDGVLRRVGSDFVELLTGEPARVRLVAFASLAAVQSHPPAR